MQSPLARLSSRGANGRSDEIRLFRFFFVQSWITWLELIVITAPFGWKQHTTKGFVFSLTFHLISGSRRGTSNMAWLTICFFFIILICVCRTNCNEKRWKHTDWKLRTKYTLGGGSVCLLVSPGGVLIRKTTNLSDASTLHKGQVDARCTEVGGKLRAPGRLRGAVTLHKSWRMGWVRKKKKNRQSVVARLWGGVCAPAPPLSHRNTSG
jgi:hypothetical protein